jgi:uncharacterized protein (TIGR00730 family)
LKISSGIAVGMAVEDRLRRAMERLCVFSGSSPGARPDYERAAEELGRALAARGIGLVYGGASVGLMGIVADAMLDAGGDAVGVIPRALVDREIAHPGLSDLRIVGSMHERKALMAELADGFVALPGGMGTLEELFEVYTWTQLGLHSKPLGLLDVRSYYAKLVAFLDHAVEERFLTVEHREMLVVEKRADALLEAFRRWRPPARTKWIDRAQA